MHCPALASLQRPNVARSRNTPVSERLQLSLGLVRRYTINEPLSSFKQGSNNIDCPSLLNHMRMQPAELSPTEGTTTMRCTDSMQPGPSLLGVFTLLG